MPANTKALVTLVMGETFTTLWETWFRKSWEPYAARHGYDMVVLGDYIDRGSRARERKPHWQKCLILEHPDVRAYEDVVWVDADILINFHAAPCIVAHNASERIGVVSHNDLFATRERTENRWDRMHRRAGDPRFRARRGPTPRERYRQAGLPDDVDDITNTGVMVLKPRRHAALLRHVYDSYDETALTSNEEKPLSYEIFHRGEANPIDPRFNQWWIQDIAEHYPFLLHPGNHARRDLLAFCVNAAWHNAYFLHFIADGYSRLDVQWVAQNLPDAIDLEVKAG